MPVSSNRDEHKFGEVSRRSTSASGSPAFFERLIVKLLLAMGYGGSQDNSGRIVGQSGDGGIDGVIDQDALGFDRFYVQAKRYALENAVGEPD